MEKKTRKTSKTMRGEREYNNYYADIKRESDYLFQMGIGFYEAACESYRNDHYDSDEADFGHYLYK